MAPTKRSDLILYTTLMRVRRESDHKTDMYPEFVECVTGITVTNKLDFHARSKDLTNLLKLPAYKHVGAKVSSSTNIE